MHLLKSGQTASPPFILARGMKDNRKDVTRMLESLQTIGRFLVDSSEELYYFDATTRMVAGIAEGDREFMKLMGRHDFCPDKAFIAQARRHAQAYGESTRIHRMAYVNTVTSTIYVFSQGTAVFKITAAGITTIQNGDDGVYFVREPGSAPFELVDLPAGCEDLLLKHVIKPFSFSGSAMSVDQARFAVIAWFCSLFLPDLLPMMPLLVLVGPPSSGKTSMMNMMSELLFCNQQSVIRTPGDPKTFDSVLGQHRVICMDNVAEWAPWLDGHMESIARRETIHVKRGGQVVEQRLDCAMALTARQFPDAGLSCITRLLPIVLEKPERSVPERVLMEAVRGNRNAIMTQLMHRLQHLLADIDSGAPGYVGSYASADFADLTYRLARTIGFEEEMADAFERLSSLHDAVLPAEQQVVILLDIWLSNPANVERKVKATELQKEIAVVAKEKGIRFQMTERSFAHWFKSRINEIRQFFNVEAWEARSRQFFYRLSRKEVAGGDF